MKKMISALAVSTALVALPANAALFDDWDTDDDSLLSQSEFTPGVEKAGWFEEWNTNGDQVLDQQEFESGLFGLFDDDDSGDLTTSEWDEGIDAWFGERAVDAEFSAWDANGDGVLAEDEFMNESDTLDTGFAEFAGDDEQIAQDEFDEGLFGWYEGDDEDELLAEDEFDPLFGLLD